MPTKRIQIENENQIHFLTMTIIEWIDIITNKIYFDIIADSLNYCQRYKHLKIFEYAIMPNHLHVIAKAGPPEKLSQVVSDFKKHTSREILKALRSDNRRYIFNLIKNSFARKQGYDQQVWQRENYPEMINSENFYIQKANYIHLNPVRKGLVEYPADWLNSSAKSRLNGSDCKIKLEYPF